MDMKLTIEQEALVRGQNIVGRAVANRSTLPILTHMLLTAEDGKLRMSSTNLEQAVHAWITADVQEDGSTTVPAKLFTDLVKQLPAGEIALSLSKNQRLSVKGGSHKASMSGLPADEFLYVPTEIKEVLARLPAEKLRRAIQLSAFAAAQDESRPTLTGVHITLEKQRVTFAATDGYRLSMLHVAHETGVEEPVSAIIPKQSLLDLERIINLLPADAVVSIGLEESARAIFAIPNAAVLVSQLIEGSFPDLKTIIPTSHTTRVVVDIGVLSQAVRVASLFSDNNIIQLELSDKGIVASSRSVDTGDSTTTVDAVVEGQDLTIAFSAKYMTEALSAIGAGEIAIVMTTAASPLALRLVGIESDMYTHVVMPMRPT